jgi:hypothetical protein
MKMIKIMKDKKSASQDKSAVEFVFGVDVGQAK